MKRLDLLRLFVLAEVSDDYEELSHISENVLKRAELCGLAVRPDDVRTLLLGLVEAGLAKAYDLSADPPVAVQGPLPADRLLSCYFWITPEGRDVLVSTRDQWPLDDEDRPRQGWCPPAN